MTETTDALDQAPPTLAELQIETGEILERIDQAGAKAEDAHGRAILHANAAADAKRRDLPTTAGDHASAAEAAAQHARQAVAWISEAHAMIERLEREVAPQLEAEQAGAPALGRLAVIRDAKARAIEAEGRAITMRDRAADAALQACRGVDWLHFHLNGHCQHWSEQGHVRSVDEAASLRGFVGDRGQLESDPAEHAATEADWQAEHEMMD
jgi:hypothetical protein